jgi:hypothetical protein
MPNNNDSDILMKLYQDIAYAQSIQSFGSITKRVRVNPDRVKDLEPLARLGNQITGGAPPPLQVRSLDTLVLDSGNLTFPPPTGVNMSGNLTLFPDGNWNFTVHMHNSGIPTYTGQLMFGVIFHLSAPPDTIIVKQIDGNIGGLLGGSRSFDQSLSSTEPNLSISNLMSIARDYDWTIDYSVNWNLTDMLTDVRTALQAAAGVAAVIF